MKHGESILARANTQVRLYVLFKEQITEFQLNQPVSRKKSSLSSHFVRFASWAFTGVTVITIMLLGWQDLSRILSGSLFLISEQILQSKSDYQSTIKLLKYAEALDSRAAFPHSKEGLIWYSQDNIEHAETSFMNAVNVDLSNGSALNNLAATYFKKRAFQQALPYQERAVQADPDNAITHYNLGLLLIEENNLPEAIREFKEASYIDPSWALPYKQRAYVYLQMQDYPSAKEEASIAIRLEVEDQESHLVNAIAQHTQGKDQEALEAIDNALKLAPGDEVSRFYKALILTRLGNYDEALSILQQLLDETNDSRQVSRIIAEINSVQRTLQISIDTETQ
jgi:tetratricopeptide (TPR) repeat protein